MRCFRLLTAALTCTAAGVQADDHTRTLRERALADETTYELVRSITTEVGPRLAGSPGDAKAVAWAVARLEALGFRNVRTEAVKVPHWERGTLTLERLGEAPGPLVAAALGGSVGTEGKPVEADVVRVPGLADLRYLTRAQVAGRIVLFTARMSEGPDGTSYLDTVSIRGRGAAEAAKLGAAAVVIRSVGTDPDTAHTGAMGYKDGVPRIPAVAISNADADRLEAAIDAGRTVRLRLTSTARKVGEATSHNVIGEVPGRTPEIVLLGAHLDSWDLATGAQDDGAGVALVVNAARLVAGLAETPRRTLRVVLFANEEFGLSGAYAYAVAHADEIERHVLALEADFGGGRVYGIASRVAPDRVNAVRAIAGALEPLGIRYQHNSTRGGADLIPLHALGVPLLNLSHDGTQYFRFHHSSADTLASIDRESLKQAAAAYAVTAYLAANAPEGFGRLPVAIDAGD
jgi:carboxypeptidase Q